MTDQGGLGGVAGRMMHWADCPRLRSLEGSYLFGGLTLCEDLEAIPVQKKARFLFSGAGIRWAIAAVPCGTKVSFYLLICTWETIWEFVPGLQKTKLRQKVSQPDRD
jgi:hypothetical protein